VSIEAKIGCASQTLNDWVKKAEVNGGKRAGVTSKMADSMKALERENREPCQANEILRKGEKFSAIGPRTMASAYFALAKFERRSKG
jgi:transposase-like protein